MLMTRFTQLVGCGVPIQQAGMGAAAPPELAAAVSEAGAFGMLGTARGGLNPATLARLLERTRELTSRPFGVNFIMRPGSVAARSPREFIEQAAKASTLVEFFYTDPSTDFVRIVHDHGALASWQVGSRDEALASADAGCDLIVAQGIAAGGHIRGTIGLLDLLCEVLEAVPEVPVLAAGGIGTGRAMPWRQAPTACVLGRALLPPRRPVSTRYTRTPSSPPARRTVSTPARSTLAGQKRLTASCVARSMPPKPSLAASSARS